MRRILVCASMPVELSGWKELCCARVPLANTDYTLGYGEPLPGLEIYTLVTGSGMVNASVAVSTAVALLRPDRVYGVGIAGGIDHELEIGQMVLLGKVIQYELSIGKFSLERGQINGPLPIWLSSTIPERIPEGLTLTRHGCADLFFDQSKLERRPFMLEELGLQTVDMESYGYLAACWMQGTEVMLIKSISDRVGKKLSKNIGSFVKRVSVEQRKVILQLEAES